MINKTTIDELEAYTKRKGLSAVIDHIREELVARAITAGGTYTGAAQYLKITRQAVQQFSCQKSRSKKFVRCLKKAVGGVS